MSIDFRESHSRPSPYKKRKPVIVYLTSDEWLAMRAYAARIKSTSSEIGREALRAAGAFDAPQEPPRTGGESAGRSGREPRVTDERAAAVGQDTEAA